MFVALVIQNAKYMRRIILSFVACLDLHYFSRIFGGKKLLNPRRVFQLWSENFLFLRRFQRDTVINLHSSSFLSDFNETFIFSTYFRKNTQISNFIKNPLSRSRVVSCGRTDGRTDRQTDGYDKTNSRFSQFCQCAINEGRNC